MPRQTPPRQVTHAELLERSAADPWVRWCLPDPLPGEAWVHDDVAVVQRRGHRPGFWIAPLPSGMPSAAESDRVRSALTGLRDGDHLRRLGARSVSVPQAHAAMAHAVLDLADGGDWEWRWTEDEPTVDARERHVIPLDDREDEAELRAFTERHNPRVWTEIGTGRVHRWVGLRDPAGDLVAIGGAEREATGIPHLAGIVTAQHRRGEGLASVVSAALTRWSLAEHGVCTLGMFSDNAAARAVYDRLGYRTARAWHSRMLT